VGVFAQSLGVPFASNRGELNIFVANSTAGKERNQGY
jgi:hypothetical protein